MSPSDLEEYLSAEPFVPVRLTLASGDQLVIDSPRRAMVAGLSLFCGVLDDPAARVAARVKIVSVPNIVLVEPLGSHPHRRNGRRRR